MLSSPSDVGSDNHATDIFSSKAKKNNNKKLTF